MRDMTQSGMKRAAILVAIIAVLFVVFTPAVAGAESDLARQIEEAFLGPGESVDNMYQLLFGIVLPFLLVFAIIHFAMRKMWPDSEKEATLVSVILALFPIPTGAYELIGDILLGISDLMTGREVSMEVAFRGTILENLVAALGEPAARLALALGFGATLALVLSVFGSKGEQRILRRHEAIAIAILTGSFYVAIGGLAEGAGGADTAFGTMTTTAGFAVILLVGAALLWTHIKKGGGMSGAVTGFLGLLIVGWAFQRPELAGFGPINEFGQLVTQGAMWIVGAIAFIVFGIFIMIFHLGSE